MGFPGGTAVKTLPPNAGDSVRSWARKIPWRRKWQPTPVFSPGESHGEQPGRLQSMGLQKVGHDSVTKEQQCTYIHECICVCMKGTI